MKKEKNGVAALFGLFFIFEIAGKYASDGEYNFEKTFWFWGFISSVIVYLILKIIKSNTKMLDEVGR